MNMIQSSSSQIQSYGYDAVTSSLRIRFRSGGTYEYAGVPSDRFDEMQASESHGKFLHQWIKPYHTAVKIDIVEQESLANHPNSS